METGKLDELATGNWQRSPTRHLHQHLHHRPAAERLLHPLLQIVEPDDAADERPDLHGAAGGQADRFLPRSARVEAAAVHAQLAREQRVEMERHRLGMDGDDADRAPDANDLGDQRRSVGAAADFECDVGAGAVGPRVHHRLDVVGWTDRVETGALQHLDAVRIDFDDFHLGAAVAADERDQRADRSAAEDHDTVAGLDLRPRDVVRRDRQRLDQRRVVIGDRVGKLQQPRGGHRPGPPACRR